MKKNSFIEKAIVWAQKKSTSEVKANLEGYELPAGFKNQATDETIQPDLSFTVKDGSVHISDIAMKEPDVRKLVTRWRLFSTMATIKKGQFHLLAPKGHKMFTQKIVEQYNINAEIHSI